MPATPQPYGRRVVLYITLAFAVVLSVNIYMVRMAIRTNTGTVMDHPYESGLQYNAVIDAAEKQVALGWKGNITFQPTAEGSGTLSFTLVDAAGAPLMPDAVRVTCYRPSQKGLDFNPSLTRDGHAYRGEITFPVQGLWEVRVFATQGDTPFQTTKRIVVK